MSLTNSTTAWLPVILKLAGGCVPQKGPETKPTPLFSGGYMEEIFIEVITKYISLSTVKKFCPVTHSFKPMKGQHLKCVLEQA